jgi:hypothetical protein
MQRIERAHAEGGTVQFGEGWAPKVRGFPP